MAWATSTRASRLPHNWAAIRQAVLTKAGHQCQATHHHPRCTGQATDVDHIIAGDNHSLANLQALSKPCHDAKTRLEAAQRNTQRREQRIRHDKHPGEID